MAQLWRHDGTGWSAVGLDGVAAEIALGPLAFGAEGAPGCDAGPASDVAGRGMPVVLRSPEGSLGGTWLLAAPASADAAVNGERPHAGLIALADRDEIVLHGQRLFFSTATVAVVVPCAASAPSLRCPRCRRPFESGVPVVRCPGSGCGVVHHQSDDLPCWRYAASCAICPQPTALEPVPPWTPEGL